LNCPPLAGFEVPGDSLEAARRFFEVNPEVTVEHLTDIVDACIDTLQEPLPSMREEDTHKHLRKCSNLSYLLLMLRQVIRECGWLEIPVARYLTRQELFGPHFDPDRPEGADDPDRPPLLTG
jgi:hypothetical protein